MHQVNQKADISQILRPSRPEDSPRPALRAGVVDHSHEHRGGDAGPEAGGTPVGVPTGPDEGHAEEADAEGGGCGAFVVVREGEEADNEDED